MSVYAILGFLAAAILLVVVAHIIALRRYATLFDANSTSRSDAAPGQVEGRIGGRDAAFSLSLPRRRPRHPGELRVSIGCSAPIAFSVERENLATGFQKAIGLRHDRASGDEELDRKFLFRFDDRARLRSCLEGTGLKRALSHLADLGVGSIWVDRGRVTAAIPLQFILPPRLEVVRDVRDQLLSAASAMESALVGRFPSEKGELAAEAADDPTTYGGYESKGRGGRTKGVAPAPAVMVVVFLVAVAIAFAIADPMWARETKASWPDRLSLMEGRLVFTTLVAGSIGLMAARLVGGKPLIWGIGLSWPMLFYTTAIWAYYFIFTMSEAPVAENFLADMEGVVTPILVLLTSAPVLFFLSGWVGARLGQQRRAEVRQRG